MSESLSERVRIRLREEMQAKRLSQRDIAGLLECSQGRIAKLMTGRVPMTVNDLSALCFALTIPVSEVVRDRGMEFYAEMTPTELRILERLRALPRAVYEAIMTLLDIRLTESVRHAGPKPKPGAHFGPPKRARTN